jgi:hypothetical protein
MGIRFRRSFKIAPGIRLNLSKSGVSTTIGARGFSVNVGRRGTYLNAGLPGTGIGSRTRLGGGRRARNGSAAPGPSSGVGYWWLGGLILFLLIAMAGGTRQPPGTSDALLSLAPAQFPQATEYEAFYLHGGLPIRAAPSPRAPLVRMLHRGDRVLLGEKGASGWAAVSEPASGYLYRASRLVRTAPPATGRQRRKTTPQGGEGATHSRRHSRTAPAPRASSEYYLGPRGGCYTYSAYGRKRYVDHSYCS